MSDDDTHIVFGEGTAGSPMEYWLREHTTAKLHRPGDDDPSAAIAEFITQSLHSDPMIVALMDAHVPKVCDECGGVSPVHIGVDWVAFSRHVEHEEDCPCDDGSYRDLPGD